MSHRRAKKARALWFHKEFGAYYPAMEKSRKELESMNLSERELRRCSILSERKVNKLVERSRREDELEKCGSL